MNEPYKIQKRSVRHEGKRMKYLEISTPYGVALVDEWVALRDSGAIKREIEMVKSIAVSNSAYGKGPAW